MTRTVDELRSVFDDRVGLYRELAIYDSVPAVNSTVIEEAVDAINGIPEAVAEISGNQFAKDKAIDQVADILSAQDGASNTGRLINLPFPFPHIWPPIWLGRAATVPADEVEFAAKYLAEAKKEGVASTRFGARAAFFLAMGAGVLVGRALAEIFRRSDVDASADAKVAFATDYIGHVGFSNVQTAAMSRPDYLSGVDECMPALDSAISDTKTATFIDELEAGVGGRTARIAPAIGFAIGVFLGYMAESR